MVFCFGEISPNRRMETPGFSPESFIIGMINRLCEGYGEGKGRVACDKKRS
jgi:hypothetical protein